MGFGHQNDRSMGQLEYSPMQTPAPADFRLSVAPMMDWTGKGA